MTSSNIEIGAVTAHPHPRGPDDTARDGVQAGNGAGNGNGAANRPANGAMGIGRFRLYGKDELEAIIASLQS